MSAENSKLKEAKMAIIRNLIGSDVEFRKQVIRALRSDSEADSSSNRKQRLTPESNNSKLFERIEKLSISELNQISTKALQNCFDKTKTPKEAVFYYQPVIARINQLCRKRKIQCFIEGRHVVDKQVKLPRVFLDHFERVTVKGDGNCLWHSVSIALVGDYSASEALRLLTAATLIEFEREFRARFDEQERKFGYKPEHNYDAVLATAVQASAWGDENHLLALSTAIGRPIYSFGDFSQFGRFQAPPGSSPNLFESGKHIYDHFDVIGHYRYVGNEVDDDEDVEPICIFYDGQAHYSAILPKVSDSNVKPWRPKTLLMDYLIPKGWSGQTNGLFVGESRDKVLTEKDLDDGLSEASNADVRLSEDFLVTEALQASLNDSRHGPGQINVLAGSKNGVDTIAKQNCGLCGARLPEDRIFLECFHAFCSHCLQYYLEFENAKLQRPPALCPQPGCKSAISEEILNFIPKNAKEARFSNQANFLRKEPDGTCPKCGQQCRRESETCLGTCEKCNHLFCIFCRKNYHGNNSLVTCDSSEKSQFEVMKNYKKENFRDNSNLSVPRVELFCKACNGLLTKSGEVKTSTSLSFTCRCTGFFRIQKARFDSYLNDAVRKGKNLKIKVERQLTQ